MLTRVPGAGHPVTLAARANMARSTGDAGDAASARDQFTALLPIREQVSGDTDPGTLTVRASVACWTGAAGDPPAARDQYAALVPVRERLLGPEHPRTLITRASLARWTGAAGRRPRPVRGAAAAAGTSLWRRASRHGRSPGQPRYPEPGRPERGRRALAR